MAEEFYSLVTDYGAEKQLKCITDCLPFEVTHIALGDGNGRYYEPQLQGFTSYCCCKSGTR
jgi:phage-related tail fiber protein